LPRSAQKRTALARHAHIFRANLALTEELKHFFRDCIMVSARLVAISASALLVLLAALPAPSVSAAESGMASIHSWRKVGKKTCMVGHQHDGNGSGVTQKIATQQAVNAWSSFTDLEYGDSWANFNTAIEKSVSCSPNGSSWTCSLLATPCRGW
jgi:hypothetical protein